MGDFITRLDNDQLSDVDRLLIRALLNSIRSAEQLAITIERPIPPEWQVVIVRADDLEAA
jgi:hypothetical protein